MLLSHAFLRLPVRRFGAALLFSLLFVLAPVYAAAPPLVLNAKSVLVVNQRTGKTLYQKQPNRVLPIASLTKLMTAMLAGAIGDQIRQYGSVDKIPAQAVSNTRNDMYLASETIKHLKAERQLQINPDAQRNLDALKGELDNATRFIPFWVKVVVAIALGLGTMVGWRRIVVTVGEKIGKSHLTYAQGASAELVAMTTIGAADAFGLPVSTTHVLSSGIAGTMAANRSGLQMATLRNLLMAWVLTLPASVLLSAVLYWIFNHF